MNKMKLLSLCDGMSDMAATHKNDMISNALARVSRKIESLGTSRFAPELDDLDYAVVKYYLSNKK
jgi:hypothetical protein